MQKITWQDRKPHHHQGLTQREPKGRKDGRVSGTAAEIPRYWKWEHFRCRCEERKWCKRKWGNPKKLEAAEDLLHSIIQGTIAYKSKALGFSWFRTQLLYVFFFLLGKRKQHLQTDLWTEISLSVWESKIAFGEGPQCAGGPLCTQSLAQSLVLELKRSSGGRCYEGPWPDSLQL